MTTTALAARIVERPLVGDRKRAASRMKALDEAADVDTAAALAALGQDTRDVLAAVFDGSPFLHDLAERDPARLVRLLASDPDAAFEDLRARLVADVAPMADETDFVRGLRLTRQEAALLIALADIGGVWDVATVTERLSRFAEDAIAVALRRALTREARRGKLLLGEDEAPDASCGFFLLGMGKLGAAELNYSSDVDLIAFYDPERVRLSDPDEGQAVFVRVTQALARYLSETTYDGYVFRVDLRLRPDPGTYPVAISTRLAESYYESIGQNWERAAMIKARPVAGDKAAGEAFLRDLRAFVWRKYLDYAAVAEVHAMKRQIHAVKGHESIAIEGHDLKLGRGGIREIEFFVQTQQLIGGGRNQTLRVRPTIEALRALENAGWIEQRTRRELTKAYEMLRRLEHRVQMVADAQTHALPKAKAEMEAFARFAGYKSRDALAADLVKTLDTVQRHYARLFEEKPTAKGSRAGTLVFAGKDDDPETLGTLKALGFSKPRQVSDAVRGWLSGRYPATRSVVARERLEEILPRLFDALAATGQADAGFLAFDQLVRDMPVGVQVFSLLRSNPGLLDLLAAILGTAPRMASVLSRRPRVLEGVIEELHAGSAAREDVAERFAASLGDVGDLQEAYDRARVFAQEQAFLIGVRVLSGVLPVDAAGDAYSRLAATILTDLHARVSRSIVERHGRTPRDASAVVAMGKLGSGEMTATSDLDLLLLYDGPFDAPSDGEKSLYATEYFTRLTQRLVAALSAPTSEGIAYALDFRLRPSGNKGPLATSLESFREYQEKEAWTWEQMALTRARVICGPPAFIARVEAAIIAAVRRPRDAARTTSDLVDMRKLILQEKPPANAWDVKHVPGGLTDVEFIAQWLTLLHAHKHPSVHARSTLKVFEAARDAGLITPQDASDLLAATRFYQAIHQVLRLTLDEPFDPDRVPRGLAALLARVSALPDLSRVEGELDDTASRVRAIARRLWGADPYRA